MSDIQKVKISNIIENQIPSFLNEDSPLFREFLEQYYISLEHETGTFDVITNLPQYKSISNFNTITIGGSLFIKSTSATLDPSTPNTIVGIDTSKLTLNDIIEPIDSYILPNTAISSIGDNSIEISRNHLVSSEISTIEIGVVTQYCKLTSNVSAFDTVINVNTTVGFPDTYGLLKIDDEIITYKGKTDTSFTECVRGFSGISNLQKTLSTEELEFNSTSTSDHLQISSSTNLPNQVINLNIEFYQKLFEKFKYQFLPGFENREFYPDLNLQNILSKAKDFYISKGTDISFKILFNILFGKQVTVIKPQDYLFRTSDNLYFKTKNILVKHIDGNLDLSKIKGKTLYQDISTTEIASGSIYNIEVRPTDDGQIYEISLDYSSTISNFNVTGTTYISENVSTNSNVLTVDSTVGFSKSGTVLIYSEDLSYTKTLTYTDKTNNQFLGVSGIDIPLKYNYKVIYNDFAYLYDDNSEKVTFQIITVITDINVSPSSNLRVGDKVSLLGIGKDLSDINEFNTWIYNIPVTHNIKKVIKIAPTIWEISFYDDIQFYYDDSVILTNPDDVNDTEIKLNISPKNLNTILVSTGLDISSKTLVKKVIRKGSTNYNKFSEINSYTANIQNAYIDNSSNNMYVMSSGIPDYEILSREKLVYLTTDASPTGLTNIINTVDENGVECRHYFYNGEQVKFIPSSNSKIGLSTGTYYIKIIGSYPDSKQISLTYSQSQLFNENYIDLISSTGVSSSGYIVKKNYENKILKHQKLFKKINLVKNNINYQSKTERSINNREVGILVNGIELYSPTLYDENIYYGALDSVFISDSGSNYDVINKPNVEILDLDKNLNPIGSGADIILNVSGSIERVEVTTPGYNYVLPPDITLVGGNGSGAILESNLVSSNVISGFRGDADGINVNEITFIDNHNFNNGEEVVYDSNSNSNISPLSHNSRYFVGVISNKVVQLYNNNNVGINTINFVGFSSGFHYFKSVLSRNTVSEIKVISKGVDYANKSVVVPSILSYNNEDNGINTFDDYIFAKNHNFKSGDDIVYSTTGTAIVGLATTTTYISTVLDNDRFKLSEVGIGITYKSNYENKKYVKLQTLGTEEHTFAYPPIQLLINNISKSGTYIEPVLNPVVLGQLDSVFIKNVGSKYGTPDIINFHRRPNIIISNVKSECILKPVISNGEIIDVHILNSGVGYDSTVDITVIGDGLFADIRATIISGRVDSIDIKNGGVGYIQSTTQLRVSNRGVGGKLIANVKNWQLNQIEKNKGFINSDDDGYLIPNINEDYGLKYIHFYLPKVLRKKINDNIDLNGVENPTNASPIVGWAYDGSPIYGPYIKENGIVRKIESSYNLIPTLVSTDLRPNFYNGFFIQDYQYFENNGDLDRNNGKFIVNSDFPNGTYAYFCTLDTNTNVPKYPYIVGKYFKNDVELDNYNPIINQDDSLNVIDILTRNISPYYANSNTSNYNPIKPIYKKYSQEFTVKETLKSGIDNISIYISGDNYKVGDTLEFDHSTSGGQDASASISRISGVGMSSFNIGITTISPIKFSNSGNNITAISTSPHNLQNGRIVNITGISSFNFSYLEGFKFIFVPSAKTGITSHILPPTLPVGIATFIPVTSTVGFVVGDFIGITTSNNTQEIAQITNVSIPESRLYVERLSNIHSGICTVGVTTITLLPRSFVFAERVTSPIKINKEFPLHFDPNYHIAYGNSPKNYNLPVTNPVVNVSIPQQAIYIPNHNLNTGDSILYGIGPAKVGIGLSASATYGGTPFNLTDNQLVYAVKLDKDFLGISTQGPVGITTLFFIDKPNYGYHSITKVSPNVVGVVENYAINVGTTKSHGLETGDKVRFNLNFNETQNIKFKYDSINRKITSDETSLNSSQVNVGVNTYSTIYIPEHPFNDGDKIVYNVGIGSTVGGLINSQSYYVLTNQIDYIRLCQYYSDVKVGTSISFTSQGTNDHTLSKINPQINSVDNNNIEFDLSDTSLVDSELIIYKDINFENELETYKLQSSSAPAGTTGSTLTILIDETTPKTLYYNLVSTSPSSLKIQISSDIDVIHRNQINISKSNLVEDFPIISTGTTAFEINLHKKPNFHTLSISGLSTVKYDTDSLNVLGPISKFKISNSGKNYFKVPRISKINSRLGTGSIIRAKSSTIGKIKTLDITKNGYDYPSDITLKPQFNVPILCEINDIFRVNNIEIVTGGSGYNVAPILKVIGNDTIKLSAKLTGGVVSQVIVDQNTNDLNQPLEIVTLKNSNGYDIDSITVSGNIVTLELINSDPRLFPLSGTFPFNLGDEIFVENCRISPLSVTTAGVTTLYDNYNSKDYGYIFYTVIAVDSVSCTVSYSMSGVKSGLNLGTYSNVSGYGNVINKKNIAQFKMNIIDDLNYISNEKVTTPTFSANVMENGWDNDTNQLRLYNTKGELVVGDNLLGELSRLNGVIVNTTTFDLHGSIGSSTNKISYLDDNTGFLNDDRQVLSDNDYYQKFSYSLQSSVSYTEWRESIHSLVHPSGFKSFSNLEIFEKSQSMSPKLSQNTRGILINIDNLSSMYNRYNFSMVTEDELLPDGSIERIVFPDAVSLKPYILNQTNKVISIDDISDNFNGNNNLIVIANLIASFDSNDLNIIGISTIGLQINDHLDFSPYLSPTDTYITNIGVSNVGINIPHKVKTGIQTSSVIVRRKINNSQTVGISSFKLTNNGTSLFYHEFDSTGISSVVNLIDNKFTITNHNFQTGQKIIYDVGTGTSIGIETSSTLLFGDVLMQVGVSTGTAIYENGYNSAISSQITGISTNTIGSPTLSYGLISPYLDGISSGIGTGAKFSVIIIYNSGNPISTSIVLREGGSGYSIGDTVSIAGTYLGGSSPTNDLSFVVTIVAGTQIISGVNSSYTNIPGYNLIGSGSNATFNVSRNSVGIATTIAVNVGGKYYTLSDVIGISGTYIGGTNPTDNLYFSPTDLGSDILPPTLYVNKIDSNNFRVLANAGGSELNLTSYGIGTHSFVEEIPNTNTTILIDNIIQSPIYNRNLTYTLSSNVGIGSTVIYLNSGISSLSSIDLLKIDSEIFKIESLGIGASNAVGVYRASLGTVETSHTTSTTVNVLRGDYNVIKDIIHFNSPPYGGISYGEISKLSGNVVTSQPLYVKSSFQGRVYSRSFSYNTTLNDKNIILDDISTQFTGENTIVGVYTGTLDSTILKSITGIITTGINIGDVITEKASYILPSTYITSIGIGSITINKSHLISSGISTTDLDITRSTYKLTTSSSNVIGIYTNTNSSVDINNNPVVLINNIYQIPGKDYIIDTPNQNTIKFISGTPNSGKIVRVGIQTGVGYQLLVGAAATVSVSIAGTISQISLNGFGSGYRIAPNITLNSSVGSGASFTSTIGLGGTITSIGIINPGIGYTDSPLPSVIIDPPLPYNRLNLDYISGISTGSGTGAKVSVQISSNSEISQFNIDSNGIGYKVGDLLDVVGIATDPTSTSFTPFRINVLEVLNDKFSAYYPGQFVLFDDISSLFNGVRKKFRIFETQNGVTSVVSLKSDVGSDLDLQNNLFIFINDVLQTPNEAYTFNTSRITFTEAPKSNSKCSILYYRGSSLDVNEVIPPSTIKEGDEVQIDENINDLYDRSQFDRTVKQIISSDSLDTFNYTGFGIDADPTKYRPLHWKKQTYDKIINGVLYSKSRPDLHSRPTPISTIIKDIIETDDEIYVDNAFPLFTNIDNISEENNDVVISEDIDKTPASAIITISPTSTSISSISILNSGSGYINTPSISISSSKISTKDPIYNWISISGISTYQNVKSLSYNTQLVSVGTSCFVAVSADGTYWIPKLTPYATSIDFNDVTHDGLGNFIICGTSANIVRNYGTSNIYTWYKFDLKSSTLDPLGNKVLGISTYSGNFNGITYFKLNKSLIAVGSSGGLFSSVGVGLTYFTETYNPLGTSITLNSVTNNTTTIVAVGNSGSIIYSTNSENWTEVLSVPTTNNLNKVIWDGNRFIAVGDSGTIISSNDGISGWSNITSGLVVNINGIRYYNNLYIALINSSDILYSSDLINWTYRITNQTNNINDYIFINDVSIGVGNSGTLMYATPIFNRATGIASVSSGIVTSITVTNAGFGYSSSNPPSIIISSEPPKVEKLFSIKAIGDFGNITKISVGGTTLDFTLKSETYDNSTLGIGYSSLNIFGIQNSQLSVGDYFVIQNSNSVCSHALTCINKFDNSVVGTATSFIDGVYIVGDVTPVVSGIITVTCYFQRQPGGGNINVNVGSNSYCGTYSWGKIYDFEDRSRKTPVSFSISSNDSLVGLTTSPKLYRTKQLI